MARRFVFRLQPVLEQREREEQACKVRVGAIDRERIAVEERLRSYQQQIAAAKQELREQIAGAKAAADATMKAGGRVRIDSVRLQSTASLHLITRAQQTVIELAGVHRRLDGVRADLARAATARKAVARLKDKQHEEWRRAASKAEAAEIDELAVMGHKRSGEHS